MLIVCLLISNPLINVHSQTESNSSLSLQLIAQQGHSETVSSVALSFDSKYLVTASSDLTARLWDVESERELRRFVGHTERINAVALTRDGKYLATASSDNTVRLWNVSSDRELRRLEGHSSTVNSVAFSPYGKTVVTGGDDGSGRVWDFVTGKELHLFEKNPSPSGVAAVSADGKYVLIADSTKHTGSLWQVDSAREVNSFALPFERISHPVLGNNGQYLFGKSDSVGASKSVVLDARTGLERRRFDEEFWAVALSWDGKYLAIAGKDRTLRVSEIETGKELQRFQVSVFVSSLTFSFDGRHLVTGNSDDARIWEIASGKELHRFTGAAKQIISVAADASGRFLVTGSLRDNAAQLWDVERGRPVPRLDSHSESITSVSMSPDGKHFATGSADKTARLWEVASGKELRRFEGHSEDVKSVFLSKDGSRLVTGGFDGTVRLWDCNTGKELGRFEDRPVTAARGLLSTFSGYFTTFASSPDSKYVVTGGKGNVAHLREVDTGKEVHKFEVQSSLVDSNILVSQVLSSPDGKYFATASLAGASLFDVDTAQEIRRFNETTDVFSLNATISMRFSSDFRYLAAGGFDKTVELFDVATGRELGRFETESSPVYRLAFAGNGKFLVTTETASRGNTTRIWEIETGKEVRHFEGHSDANKPIFGGDSSALSSDARYLATVNPDYKTLQLWEVETGKAVRRFEGHSEPVYSVNFSRDGKYLITGSKDKTARLWEVASGQERLRMSHPESVYVAEASPDGRYLVTASADRKSRLWDVETGKELRVLDGHSGPITSVVFSDDGKYLATASIQDSTVLLFEVATSKNPIRLAAESKSRLIPGVSAMGFVGNTRYLVTGGGGWARLWDVGTGKLHRNISIRSKAMNSMFPVTTVALSAEARYLFTASSGGAALIWDVASESELIHLERHPGRAEDITRGLITSAIFTEDGKYLVTGGMDKTARLLDVQTGRELRRFEGHLDGVTSLALTGEGRYLVTGSRDATTRIWDLSSGAELCRLIFFKDGSWSVSDPEGRYDCSSGGGVRGMYWVLENRIIPLEQLKDQFYEPQLLNKILSRQQLRTVPALSDPTLLQRLK